MQKILTFKLRSDNEITDHYEIITGCLTNFFDSFLIPLSEILKGEILIPLFFSHF